MLKWIRTLIPWIWNNRNRRFVCASVLAAAGADILFLALLGLPELAVLSVLVVAYAVSAMTHERYLALGASCVAMLQLLTLLLLAPTLQSPLASGGMLLASTAVFLLLMMTMVSNIQQQEYYSSVEADRQLVYKAVVNDLRQARSLEAIYQLILSAVEELYSRSAVLFARDADGTVRAACCTPPGLLFYDAELAAAEAVFASGQLAGRFEEHCQYSPFLFFPLKSGETVLAVVALLYADGELVNDSRLEEFMELMRHSVKALDYQLLADRQQQVRMERERERMRADFLRGMSHDIRSPLTGIMSACSTLLQSDGQLAPEVRTRLLTSIHEESEWLLHMVENLLSVTRVNPSSAPVRKSPELAEDLLGEIAARCARRFPRMRVRVSTPGEPLVVPMDTTLIIQVLMNLVENAVKYSGSDSVELCVDRQGAFACFSVRDYGVGLSARTMEGLFSPTEHSDQEAGHGLGIGLSICQSIIHAHGGVISGENCPDAGAVFTFTLPMEECQT